MSGPIVITGGGTGGHIFSMEAIAEQLRSNGVKPDQLRYVGSRRGQESTLLAGGEIQLTLLPGRGIRRSLRPRAAVENIGAVVGLCGAVIIALVKVARWRPSVVVSVGGYASFAVALAAVVLGRPIVLVELDTVPGAAQRIFSRFARVRCRAFPSGDARSVVTGVPLRHAIVSIDRSPGVRRAARARTEPAIEESRRVIVVMTGSLGATRVNRAVSELARLWANRDDCTIIHVTGRRDYAKVRRERPITKDLDYRITEFADMTALWAVCDVAVCRAGGATVGELTALAIPSVLVPLPGAPDDHQTRNAEAVVEAGGARLVVDDECTGETLGRVLDDIMVPETLADMSQRAGSLGRSDAAQTIARVVLDVGDVT